MRIARRSSLLAFGLSLFCTFTTASTLDDFDSKSHLAVPGDFNGDGRLDVLMQPLVGSSKGAIILQDGTGQLSVLAQGWDTGYLGLDWSTKSSTLTTADLNGDGQDDVVMQPVKAGGTAVVLLTDPTVQLLQISQLLPVGYLNLDWSSETHHAVAGDFDGDRRKELFMQATGRNGLSAIVHTDETGHIAVVTQTFVDGYLGRHWNSKDEVLYVGDFNGDGRQDLLVQSQGAIPGESAYALLLADGDGRFTHIAETWNLKDLGANWNAASHKVVIEDANHDGIMDIVLQATATGGTNYLFEGNAQGLFMQPSAHWTGDKSASDVAASIKSTSSTSTKTSGTGVGIILGGGATAKTITAPSNPEQNITSRSSNQGGQGSGQLMTVNAAGSLQGSGGVSGGTATYSIPIAVPPGIVGMQPSISLNYSSRGGNGEMGMGWSLSAGSQIHRCPATQAMDGYSTGVTYTSTDRLCLDGQHLIYVNGGTGYGSDGATYRTELDSFAQITESGDISGSSTQFTVQEKNGHTLRYGNSTITPNPHAIFTPSGAPAPLAWGLASEVDTNNNNIIYFYSTFGSGEYLLTSIKYTGNGSNVGNREVDFNYGTRGDPTTQYLAGGLTTQSQVLSSITVLENGSTVRTYNTAYSSSAATGRTLLAGVQECAFTNGAKACLPETTFTWQNPALHFTAPEAVDEADPCVGGAEANQPYLTPAGDINGDGIKDVIYSADCEVLVYLMGPNGSVVNQIDITNLFNPQTTYQVVDVDGDGRADIVAEMKDGNLGYATYNSVTKAFDGPFTLGQSFKYSNSVYQGVVTVQDVNGDGLPDVVVVMPDTDPNKQGNYMLAVYLNNTQSCTTAGCPPTFSFTPTRMISEPFYIDLEGYRNVLTASPVADMDGNGIQDFEITYLDQTGTTQRYWVFPTVHTDGSVTFPSLNMAASGLSPAGIMAMNMDINGDGLPDMVYDCGHNKGTDWCYSLNSGNIGPHMFNGDNDTLVSDDTTPLQKGGEFVADYDNDGQQEMLYPDALLADFCIKNAIIQGGEGVTECANSGSNQLQPSQDLSIYQFAALKFEPQVFGSGYRYVPIQLKTDIQAQTHLAEAIDLIGDGLTSIVSPFTRWYSDCEFIDNAGYDRPTGIHVVANSSGGINSQNAAPDLMLTASNGFGINYQWDYYPLSSAQTFNHAPLYYSPGIDGNGYAGGDYFYFSSSMFVVGDYLVSDGVGGTREHDFHYAGAIYNNQGRGFQGFRVVVDDDDVGNDPDHPDNAAANSRTVQIYHQRFPLSGELLESWTTSQSSAFDLTALMGSTEQPIPQPDPKSIETVVNTWGCMQGGPIPINADGITCKAGYLTAKTYAPVLIDSLVSDYDVTNNAKLSTTDTHYCSTPIVGTGGHDGSCTGFGYDIYGNLLGSLSFTTDSVSTHATGVTYDVDISDVTDWWVNKLMSKTVVVDANYSGDAGAKSRETDYDYYSNNRLLYHVNAHQDSDPSGKYLVTTQYTYGSFGGVTEVSVTGGTSAGGTLIPERDTQTSYSTGADADYFVSTVTDPMGLMTSYTMDPRFGSPTVVVAPSGTETLSSYDGFGRKITSQVYYNGNNNIPVQNISYITAVSGDGMCDSTTASSQYYVLTNQTGYPSHYECYDAMNRVIRSAHESISANSNLVLQSTAYDNRGRVTQFTEPHFADASWLWNTNQYDDSNILGRLSSKTDAKGVVSSYTYNQGSGDFFLPINTTIETTTPNDPINPGYDRIDEEVKDSTGKLLSVTNAVGATGTSGQSEQATTTYSYDSDGNPISIKAADGTIITAYFNSLGQKESVVDPDQGTTTYVYDVAGDLVSQTDANNQTLTMTYDLDGRMVKKVSTVSAEPEVDWVYDAGCSNGAGKLCSVSVADGSYSESYAYNVLGLVKADIETIDGTSYETDTAYDSDGRIDTVTYPSSISDKLPAVDAGGTQYAAPNATVNLQGTASDPDGGPQALDYQWSQTSGPAVTLSSTTSLNTSFTAGSNGSSYAFQLSADDGLATGSDTVTVTVPALPAVPAGLTDDGDTDHDGNYTVSWHPVSVTGASVVYHLQEAGGNSSGPTVGWQEIYAGAATSHPVSHLENTYYYDWYQVRAEIQVNGKSAGFSAFSGTDSIHVVVTPGAPASISPFGASTTTGVYGISWGAYTGDVKGSDVFYQLEEDSAPGFATASIVYTGTANSASFTKTALGDWYYRVRACNQDGTIDTCSGWTGRAHETIIGTGGIGCKTCQPQVVIGGGPIGGAVPIGGTQVGPAKAAVPVTSPKPTNAKPPIAKLDVPAAQAPAYRRGQTAVHKELLATHVGNIHMAGNSAHIRPRFAPPVYKAWADAKLQNAAGTTPIASFTVQYIYSPNGYLYQLVDGINPSRVYWYADVFADPTGGTDSGGETVEHGMNAYGQVTDVMSLNPAGNAVATHYAYDGTTDYLDSIVSTGPHNTTYQNLSYTWQAIGNLQTRASNPTGTNPNTLSESFTYDIHNRLTSSTVTNGSGAQTPVGYAYDSVGDITCRTDTNSTCSYSSPNYTYGASGAGPHAVTAIAGTVNTVANPSYSYDADGNMTSRAGTTITWNSDNLPTSITQDSNNSSTFSYAPDKHRYKQTAMNGGAQETTIYAGGIEIFTSGGVTKYRHTLSAYGRPVFLDELSSSSTNAPVETQSFLLTDHLGSVDTVVDANALTGATQSFDTFGHHRDPNTWMPVSGNGTTVTKHGFTHHEHLDNVGLIHMNGRVYDETIGRFLSVDPMFQSPRNSQSINPYSYVMNNPLSLVDPSGYAAACTPDSTGSTASCTAAVSDLKPGESKTATITTTTSSTGSHIDSHSTVTGTVTMNKDGSVSVKIDSPNGATGGSTGTSTPSISNAGGSGNQGSPNQRQSGLSVTWSDGCSANQHTFNMPDAPPPGSTSVWEQGWSDVVTLDGSYKPHGGPNSISQIAGIVYHETRGMDDHPLENRSLDAAKSNIAHVRLNGLAKWGSKIDGYASMASPIVNGSDEYQNDYMITIRAVAEDLHGVDPTHGSILYNMRSDDQDFAGRPFYQQPVRTQSGPYDSPTKYDYIETYGPKPPP